MQAYITKATENTPEVILDSEKNVFSFVGESRPENTKVFYVPIIDWIKQFSLEVNISNLKPIAIEFRFDYFSSTSAKYLINFLGHFEGMVKKGVDVSVIWKYRNGDTQIKESGEEFQKIINLPFKFETFSD